MSTVAAPPRPPQPRPTDEPEALFEEARQHRRHRWIKLAAGAAAAIAAAAGAYFVLAGGTTHPSTTLVLKNGVLTAVPNQTVVLLVDLSASMGATDVKPTRLQATVAGMRTLIDRLPEEFEVGVVAFSDTVAVTQVPTRDRRVVLDLLAKLEPIRTSTALGDALTWTVGVTVDSLAREGVRRAPGHDLPAVIILASDGAESRGRLMPRYTPLEAARRAQAAGLRVVGIAPGTPTGRIVHTYNNHPNIIVPVPPDAEAVAHISRVTGGESFTAPTAERLESIYTGLAATISR